MLIQDVDPKAGDAPTSPSPSPSRSCSGCSAARGLDGIATEGDAGVVGQLLAVLDPPNPGFAIVTP